MLAPPWSEIMTNVKTIEIHATINLKILRFFKKSTNEIGRTN